MVPSNALKAGGFGGAGALLTALLMVAFDIHDDQKEMLASVAELKITLAAQTSGNVSLAEDISEIKDRLRRLEEARLAASRGKYGG